MTSASVGILSFGSVTVMLWFMETGLAMSDWRSEPVSVVFVVRWCGVAEGEKRAASEEAEDGAAAAPIFGTRIAAAMDVILSNPIQLRGSAQLSLCGASNADSEMGGLLHPSNVIPKSSWFLRLTVVVSERSVSSRTTLGSFMCTTIDCVMLYKMKESQSAQTQLRRSKVGEGSFLSVDLEMFICDAALSRLHAKWRIWRVGVQKPPCTECKNLEESSAAGVGASSFPKKKKATSAIRKKEDSERWLLFGLLQVEPSRGPLHKSCPHSPDS